VGAARRFVRDIQLGSELVVSLREQFVRVEVCDGDPSPPIRRAPDVEAASVVAQVALGQAPAPLPS